MTIEKINELLMVNNTSHHLWVINGKKMYVSPSGTMKSVDELILDQDALNALLQNDGVSSVWREKCMNGHS